MNPEEQTTLARCELRCERLDDTFVVRLMGPWTIQEDLPEALEVQQHLDATPGVRQLAFETRDLTAWDSGLLTFLRQVIAQSTQRPLVVEQSGLPDGVRRLLALAAAVPEREGARRSVQRLSWLAGLGTAVLEGGRRADLLLFIQECGAQALGIVTLISFLIGLILAFMGAVQLRQFGAEIYTADLVGLGMTREMGAVMTGVIIAGRTGAAFAAQLGTMQVNEEIDALVTMGIPPMDFLVLPRMLALIVMMPLLCIYADMVGILAGVLVGTGMLHLSLVEYVNETRHAVDLVDCALGVGKSAIFGALVALAGCLRGMQCGRSAAAVGSAATSAVVTGIVWIIASDGLFAVLTERLGI